MKRFIIIIAAVAGFVFSANAQTYYDDGELSVSHDTFCLNGMPLDDDKFSTCLEKKYMTTSIFQRRRNLKPPALLSISVAR